MSDGTSAEIFGTIFEMLAANPTPEHEEMAMRIFRMSYHYDFSPYQMYTDDACLTLGVAKMGIDPDYPEDGEVILWPGDKGYEKATRV